MNCGSFFASKENTTTEMKGCVNMKIRKSWCESCIKCQNYNEIDFRKRYYYCCQYIPFIKNKLNFIDEIIKKWEENKK